MQAFSKCEGISFVARWRGTQDDIPPACPLARILIAAVLRCYVAQEDEDEEFGEDEESEGKDWDELEEEARK